MLRRFHAQHSGPAAGLAVFAVFCSDLSAIDISSSAEILGCRGVGDLRNSEMTSVLPLFLAVCDANATIARCHPRLGNF